jgi:hypothetical protein
MSTYLKTYHLMLSALIHAITNSRELNYSYFFNISINPILSLRHFKPAKLGEIDQIDNQSNHILPTLPTQRSESTVTANDAMVTYRSGW